MIMKRLITLFLFLCVTASLSAQGRVTTRKYLFSDFQNKITKVVMSGNDVLDGALRQAVVDLWTASPFEFCPMTEYETLKKGTWYGRLRRRPAVPAYLPEESCLRKGGRRGP